LESFHLQGFGDPTRIATKYWDLFLFAKYLGEAPAVHFGDAGSFAACSGTLVYDGVVGTKALETILEKSSTSSIDWDRAQGSFCILIGSDAEIYLRLDKLGTYKIYQNELKTVLSSSFLAVLETITRPTANAQSIYEYVFQGATYGDRTVVEEIKMIEPRSMLRLGEKVDTSELPNDLWAGKKWLRFGDHVALTHAVLRENIRALIAAFGHNIDTALSGGFDSRLLLALLREQGITPRVHVYGSARDADVVVAKTIAAAEGLPIIHTDKSYLANPSVEEFPATISRNFLLFDGYPSDGIFDNGGDVETRRARAYGGALALNGGGGEVLRNFFYLRDGSFSIRQVMWAFYCQFDPAVCTDAFSEHRYLETMSKATADVLGYKGARSPGRIRLSRMEVESLYPCLRCAYWMGRNNSINNRFGYASTPFVESSLVKLALQIPLTYKNFGRFEATLIHAADPALARYTSAYGEGFDASPSVRRKLKEYATIYRPTWVRRVSYRIRNRFRRHQIGFLLTSDYLSRVIDTSFPEMRRYFRVDKVKNETELNRICTLEYMFQKIQPNHGV
jgi:asparagine synthase (glutamine-hydrolysing)